MSELPFMKFFPVDYLRDTEILSLSAQGGWMRMLCGMWHPSRRGVLSLRLQAMARLLHASEQTTKSIIEEIGECEVGQVEWSRDGAWVTVTCRRIVRDWEKADAEKQSQIDAGKRGAAKRWGNRGGISPPDSPPLGTPMAIQKPEARSQIDKRERERAGDFPPWPAAGEASAIVGAYPRREKTADALAIVAKHLADGEDFEAMLAGTRACAAVIRTLPSGPRNRYVPSSEAFFRSKRWKDDPETLRRQGNPSNGQGQMSLDEAKKLLGGRAANITD